MLAGLSYRHLFLPPSSGKYGLYHVEHRPPLYITMYAIRAAISKLKDSAMYAILI